ncbi:MAG: amidohydrolase family protein [Pseudomonadota bacterium]
MIDAHQHYWRPVRGDYGWMPPGDPVLDRDYLPGDLAPQRAALGIEGTVLVQAAPSVAETEFLLGLADGDESIRAVVGWIDFEDPADRAALDRIAAHPRLRGVRPMIQDIPDNDWMLRSDSRWAFDALTERGLRFDALGFPRHLDQFLTLLERHPDLAVVIDHCMKPTITDPAAFDHWADGMNRLARETGAFCKLSGLVTEAEPDWSVETLRPYAEHVLDAFGPTRVMWGSDWPVCRLRAEYGVWFDAAWTVCAGLDDAGRAAVFGGTARAFYGI